MSIMEQLSERLQAGDVSQVAELTRSALEQRLEPKKILDDGLIAGMAVIGEKFKAHEIFLPDVLLAAKAMYAGLDLLKPLLEGEEIPSAGRVVIGTVKGDIHDIGKNLVGIMLKGAGFEVIDLGKDVPPVRFIEAAVESNAHVIGLSTLLTTTMPVMKEVVELARERGIHGKVKIIVGGAPLSDDYARKIGADGYGFDGQNAVDRIKSFIAAA